MHKGLLYFWKTHQFCFNTSRNLAIQLNILPPIAHILCSRGLDTKEKAQNFIFPLYNNDIYNPSRMLHAEESIKRIMQAIEKQEKILIAGDYDVDGITSTSLLLYALSEIGAHVNFFLPNRVIDGYGLSKKTIEKAYNNKYDLVITVDNGISAHEALAYAKEIGLDVIITDHHQPPDPLPDGALYIVNPHQKKCQYPFKELAGVGVAFKLVQLLYKYLNKNIPPKIYELFLLGTIADVVPLVEENRYWVSQSLNQMSHNHSYAIEILKQNTKVSTDKPLTSSDIGFSIAPQLNALGRLEDPRQGVIFLISNNKNKIEEIGSHLMTLNKTRKDIEKKIIDHVLTELKKEQFDPKKEGLIAKYSDEYPAGVIGLVAARLCQTYGVPTTIFHETKDGILKGSCRSIPECNLYECLSKIDPSLIISFGGHAGAAGLSLKKEHFNEFKKELQKIVLSMCGPDDLQQKIILDAELELDEINSKLWHDLKLLEPFGSHNPLPQFMIKNVTIIDPILLKDVHVKATVKSSNATTSIMFFNKPEWFNLIKENQKFDASIAAKITENNWNNKQKIELIGIDIMYNSQFNQSIFD